MNRSKLATIVSPETRVPGPRSGVVWPMVTDMFFVAIILLVLIPLSPIAMSQEAAVKKPAAPAMQPPVVNESLPNVLIIGDSISIGYTLDVRELLQGQANVFRPATNCGPTSRGTEQLDTWIGSRAWDVIHFNFGLHDVKYMGAADKNLADPKSPGSHQQVPLDDYLVNLRLIAERLKATGAAVIWCSTTPIPEGAKGRVAGDEVRYNTAAAELLQEIGGITTHDLHAFAKKSAVTEQKKADVHFTPKGSKLLARQVAQSIQRSLPQD